MPRLLDTCLLHLRKLPLMLESRFDGRFLSADVQPPRNVAHHQWQEHLFSTFNRPGLRILEIGSREVTGKSQARHRFNLAEYTGFDYYPGANVDVVGDVHRLGQYFGPDERFDLIFSSACFEHFAMPWRVSTEIARLLRVGGTVFVETHFSFSSHERPWHFFQFSDLGLQSLFPPALGFECIDSGMSNPIVGRFSSLADHRLRNRPVTGLYCHSEFMAIKVADVTDFSWDSVDLDHVTGSTQYPAPSSPSDTIG